MCGAALTAGALLLGLSQSAHPSFVLVAVTQALVIAVPITVGLYALQREPGSRFARLLVAAGFLWAPAALTSSPNSTVYSVGRIWAWLLEASLIYLVLAFPSGRLSTRAEKIVVVAAAVVVGALYLPTAFVVHQYPLPNPWAGCGRHCPPNAFMVSRSTPHLVATLVEPLQAASAVTVYVAVALILGLRLTRGSRLMRRTLFPVLALAIVRMLATAAFFVARRADRWGPGTETLGHIALLAIPALVVGFLLGLLHWRLIAAFALRRLAGQLGGPLTPRQTRDLIAAAVADPSLQIAYWGGPDRWVDHKGRPVALPYEDPVRDITEIAAKGHPVAALVHDAAHAGEPAVREVAGGFVLMALENQRLNAELHVSLTKLRQSRARILSAVDTERRRIERDLHDGAQQRLVALRVGLQVAADDLEERGEDTSALLRKFAGYADAALEEVRSLAHGVYPPLLADHGLDEALRSAARRSPLTATVNARGIGRFAPEVESVAYFCCLEALQNAEKHSGAKSVAIDISIADGQLHCEVRDDGRGFGSQESGGLGLANMRDRLASVGGTLTIESASGHGARVLSVVPIAGVSSDDTD